jgi:hypothetical protein
VLIGVVLWREIDQKLRKLLPASSPDHGEWVRLVDHAARVSMRPARD